MTLVSNGVYQTLHLTVFLGIVGEVLESVAFQSGDVSAVDAASVWRAEFVFRLLPDGKNGQCARSEDNGIVRVQSQLMPRIDE